MSSRGGSNSKSKSTGGVVFVAGSPLLTPHTQSLMTQTCLSPLLQRHNIQRVQKQLSPSPQINRHNQIILNHPQQQQQPPTQSNKNINNFNESPAIRGHVPTRDHSILKETNNKNGPLDNTLSPDNKQSSAQNKTCSCSVEIVDDFNNNDPNMATLVQQVRVGLHKFGPELCDEGVNGVYFMKNSKGKRIAVFKPQDEEGNSELNPKKEKIAGSGDLCDGGVRKDFKVGEACYREVAAYLLDRKAHFYGVPNTCMVKITYRGWPHEKVGSLQEYVMNDGVSEDVGSSSFPVNEVHKIGILDLHIFNTDRHGGNILISDDNDAGVYTLTPIDHGYSLPTSLDRAWFDWLSWPQCHIPFDEETKSYIASIDVDDDMQVLSKYLPLARDCLIVMKISTTLLKKGAAKNLTLYQLGDMASRKTPETPSLLEMMVEDAMTQAKKTVFGNVEHHNTSSTTCQADHCNGSTNHLFCCCYGNAVFEKVFFDKLSRIMDKNIAHIKKSSKKIK